MRCTMTIVCSGLADTYSWYQIWGIGVAINGICIRQDHGGYQTDLGMSNRALNMNMDGSLVSRSE